MTVTATYLVEAASGLTFSESTGSQTWVHALPIGAFKHPVFGTIDITAERAQRFAESVKAKVRGIDPSINYEHDDSKDAAGWVKDAEARSDGVWLLADWVADAATAIKDKKWRYFSAEFADEWVDQQGKKHTDVIMGGALSNRPFVKSLAPINLSEATVENALDLVALISGQTVDSLKGGTSVELSDEAMDKIVDKLAVKLTDARKGDPVVKKLTEIPELKALAEENPMVKALLAHVESQNADIQSNAQRLREAEITQKLSDFDRSQIVLTPVAKQRVVNLLNQMPTELSEEFWTLLTEMKRSSAFLVELGERAGTTVNYGSPKSAAKLFDEATTKLMSEAKLTYTDAVERVASENPNLYKRYRDEQFEGVNR